MELYAPPPMTPSNELVPIVLANPATITASTVLSPMKFARPPPINENELPALMKLGSPASPPLPMAEPITEGSIELNALPPIRFGTPPDGDCSRSAVWLLADNVSGALVVVPMNVGFLIGPLVRPADSAA